MIGLVWLAAFGLNVAIITEETTFKDMAECTAFGETMASRAADYARGMYRLDWSYPVQIEFHCAANGQPA